MKKKKIRSEESEVCAALGARDWLYFLAYQPQRGYRETDPNKPNIYSDDYVRFKVKLRRMDRHTGQFQRISCENNPKGEWIDCPFPRIWEDVIWGSYE